MTNTASEPLDVKAMLEAINGPYPSLAREDLRMSAETIAREHIALTEQLAEMRRALECMVYETTHLSPCRDDGSHDCRISGDALAQARAALASGVKS